MPLTLIVKEDNYKGFFKGICSYSGSSVIKDMFSDSNINWDIYDTVPVNARGHFIQSMVWAKLYPTSAHVKKIFLTEKLIGPIHALLITKSRWYYDREIMGGLVKEALSTFTTDEFIKFSKKVSTRLDYVIEYCSREHLPLIMAHKNLNNYTSGLLEKRIKSEV